MVSPADNTIWPHLTVGHPSYPPLLFLHGFMGSGSDWLPLAERCAGHYFCILPDLPGHGQNTGLALKRPLNFDIVISGLKQLIDRLVLERVHLIGYSMGGRVALYFATKQPDAVETLILESANPGLVDEQARRSRAAVDDARAKTLLDSGIDDFVERWYELGLFSSLKQHPYLLAQTKAKRKQNDPRWAAKVIRELSPGRQPPLWSELGQLSIPVLLVAGALDDKYAALMATMADMMPAATVEIVAGAGHNVQLEQPARFEELVLNFFHNNRQD